MIIRVDPTGKKTAVKLHKRDLANLEVAAGLLDAMGRILVGTAQEQAERGAATIRDLLVWLEGEQSG